MTTVRDVSDITATLAAVQTPIVSRFFGCRPLGPVGLGQAALATAAGTGVALVQRWRSGRE